METISANELKRYVDEGNHLIIDLRSQEEYVRGHVRGAVNVPQGNFGNELLGREKEEIILYCDRGGLSMTVGRELEEKGYHAKSVVGGFKAFRESLSRP